MGQIQQDSSAHRFAGVIAQAQTQLKTKQQSLFAIFAREFLADFPIEDWATRSDGDCAKGLLDIWHQLQILPADVLPVDVLPVQALKIGWLAGPGGQNRKVTPRLLCVLLPDKPFLVESLRMVLNRNKLPSNTLTSTVLQVQRGKQGELLDLNAAAQAPMPFAQGMNKEALLYAELGLLAPHQQAALDAELRQVFRDVALVVEDYAALLTAIDCLQSEVAFAPIEQKAKAQEFLRWLKAGHFTFLGFRCFNWAGGGRHRVMQEDDGARLGLFRKLPTGLEGQWSTGMARFHDSDSLVGFSKSSTRSTVHRRAYPDYIVVKRYNPQGQVIGEARILGLFAYAVYTLSPFEVPLLRHKVNQVLEHAGFDPNAHHGKNLRRVIEHYPRDELFQASTPELQQTLLAVARINERRVVKLIFRRDPFSRFVTVVAYIPRDVYNTYLRLGIESLISRELHCAELDSTTYFSESILARAHMVFRLSEQSPQDIDVLALEHAVQDLARSWPEALGEVIQDTYGETDALDHLARYGNAFPLAYQAVFPPAQAAAEIALLGRLTQGADMALDIISQSAEPQNFTLKIFHQNSLLELSDVVPLLECLGMKVVSEHSYCLTPQALDRQSAPLVYLHHFELRAVTCVTLNLEELRDLFIPAFLALWHKEVEIDGFNRLILAAHLPWRDVLLLRVYAGYLKQTLFPYAADALADALLKHSSAAKLLVQMFHGQFASATQGATLTALRIEFMQRLDAIDNLNEDRILRRYADLIQASVRTNFYQRDGIGNPKNYVSIKLAPRRLADIPEPRPLFEIYVYSPRVEGVHLRTSKVARGGLRWSDRLQDYRTEVLGLVKAQQVKNAVIVPSGAKGGFIPKQMPNNASRDQIQAEGIACYRIFIQGLLDLTDNYQNGQLVAPRHVVCLDEPDPYLVVAADKGTATFSDIANSISADYHHWLGDAFASGGSLGYDHKSMGITAKGAWVAVERHFRELGRSTYNSDFTVVGIGDMAGDVFGNGMLLSPHICLVAAFNHQHIFIDPTPNSATSFIERERLFKLPRSSWADYDASLISPGGGIFQRSAKSIALTPEMRACLDVQAQQLTPNELINAILQAPVDLLWNGGIGTYVKSCQQTHSDIGDKANDALRVNGAQLRCKIFGEGGNLGMSQLGRIEYCLQGGACNTDFIDNAGGVDCSDHEVNIKIALDELVVLGRLSGKQRNSLLASMTQQVADLVLQNVARQTQALSLAQAQGSGRMTEYLRFIQFLESSGRLNRSLEFLGTEAQFQERLTQSKLLTRPELAILMSYAKVMLKEAFTNDSIAGDAYLATEALKAFPVKLRKKFPVELSAHRLLAPLVGTQIANDLVNNLGITVAQRLAQSTGASFPEIAKAYITARDALDFESFQELLTHTAGQISAADQLQLFGNMNRRLRRATRWFLRNRRQGINPGGEVPQFKQGLSQVLIGLTKLTSGRTKMLFDEHLAQFAQLGLPKFWAQRLAMPDNLFSGLCSVEGALQSQLPVVNLAQCFYQIQELLDLDWFASALSDTKVDNAWQAQMREVYLDDLALQIRRMAVAYLQQTLQQHHELAHWFGAQAPAWRRWQQLQQEVQGQQPPDFAVFAVAMRHLTDLAQALEVEAAR